MGAKVALPGQTLLFDADDTLWENYIYFEQAIADFIAFLDHHVHTPAQVRETLNQCERENIERMGYGLASFEISLVQCFERLLDVSPTPGQQAEIRRFAHGIAHQPVQLLPGVAETLHSLAQRHSLVLVTKGHPLEQMDKFDRSGLRPLFDHAEVLPEKHADAYRALVSDRGLDPASCWMIGNSPKSDIVASLAAGLHAVHVPHEQTWVLEECEIAHPEPPQCFLSLRRFDQLQDLF